LGDYAVKPRSAGSRWLYAYSIGIVLVYGLFFALFLRQSGPEDYDQFLVFHKLQYWNTALFGIAKQWSPLMCSGLSLAGEPQVPFMSLSMALSYLIEPARGLQVATFIYFLAGWTGALLYSGLWFPRNGQRVLAAALFVGNGFFVCRLGYGHIDFIPFLILPLVLWALHRCIDRQRPWYCWPSIVRMTVTMVLMGALFALAIDGSPVAIIHLLLWIGLYALVLACTARTLLPVLVFAAAVVLASLLDAGYLWPMLQAQTVFPRRTPDTFTSMLSFIWFAILPVRGKLLPANGNGHELSVFVGPVLLILMWKYRGWLAAHMPKDMKHPLLVVAVVSIILGMGSLRSLHVPVWLSPFDLLRPLPGFRSVGVTGRYWGFLALPLSLLGAAALWRYLSEPTPHRRMHIVAGLGLLLQLGFQSETLFVHWRGTPAPLPATTGAAFRSGPEDIEYVKRQGRRFQGEFIAPTRGVIDCYDMDEFIHADIRPGKGLIRRVIAVGNRGHSEIRASARFVTWSNIQIVLDALPGRSGYRGVASANAPVRIVLNQAFHPLWQSAGCSTLRSLRGNLILECPLARLQQGPLELTFDDKLSDFSAYVSTMSWTIWLLCAAVMALALLASQAARAVTRWTGTAAADP
jgi:hypothetical protein